MEIDYNLYPGRILKKTEFEENNSNPIISIITGYYNGDEYIDETVKSVLNQTFPSFEWIIVDDGSTKKEAIDKLVKKMKELQLLEIMVFKNQMKIQSIFYF